MLLADALGTVNFMNVSRFMRPTLKALNQGRLASYSEHDITPVPVFRVSQTSNSSPFPPQTAGDGRSNSRSRALPSRSVTILGGARLSRCRRHPRQARTKRLDKRPTKRLSDRVWLLSVALFLEAPTSLQVWMVGAIGLEPMTSCV
jgi:hypothetical protein